MNSIVKVFWGGTGGICCIGGICSIGGIGSERLVASGKKAAFIQGFFTGQEPCTLLIHCIILLIQ
ncbi:MAG TPA: hypothetical protein VHK69_07375, partial [Chitinophagaceae bacterium]|nr:hypothetical protein [Chitinophagaceae bacterium]